MADVTTTVDAAVNGATSAEPEEADLVSTLQRENALVGLGRIRLHPLNLRRELRGVEELAESIRQNGLLEPVLLVPNSDSPEDEEHFLLVAGHRRYAACIKAKHDPIEAIIRRDLDREGLQVLAMLTENGPRDDLTPIEEAHGYQLALSLNSMTPTRLAKRLGRPRDKITSRIALARLPERVQQKVHARQLSLADAEVMVEFADDGPFVEVLETLVGTNSFQYRVEHERRRREIEARKAALQRELRAAGARLIEPPQRYPWNSTEKPVHQLVDRNADPDADGMPAPFTPEQHAAACPLHAVFIHPQEIRPEYVCTDPEQAGHISIYERATVPESTAPADVPSADAEVDVAAAEAERLRQAEEVRQQAEEVQRQRAEAEEAQAQRREALEVAARLRRSFLITLVRQRGRDHLTAVLRFLLGENFEAWLSDADFEDARELAALIDARVPDQAEDDSDDDRWDDVVTNLRAALSTRTTPDAIVGALLAIVSIGREWSLARGHGWSDPISRRYLYFLDAQGYGPIELEQELLRDAIEES